MGSELVKDRLRNGEAIAASVITVQDGARGKPDAHIAVTESPARNSSHL